MKLMRRELIKYLSDNGYTHKGFSIKHGLNRGYVYRAINSEHNWSRQKAEFFDGVVGFSDEAWDEYEGYAQRESDHPWTETVRRLIAERPAYNWKVA